MLESIRRRLTLGYIGVFALILALFGVVVVVSFRQTLTYQEDRLLMQKAEAGADAVLAGRGQGDQRAETESEIAVVALTPDGEPYQEAPDRGASGSLLGLPFSELAREAARGGREAGEGYEPEPQTEDGPEGAVRVVSMPVVEERDGELLGVVQAAHSRAVVQDTVVGLVSVLSAVGFGTLLLAAVGGLYMSGRAMRPAREAFARQRAFIADASHELKTPLSLVKINAEVIQRNPTDPDNCLAVEDQLSEIDRMDALLSDLLTLARLDAGGLEMKEKPFDLALVAAETAGRFLTRAANEGVRLEIDVPDELSARGDAGSTSRILAALLDNAIRHTPERGVITVRGRALDGRAQAIVADTGPGIPPEHLPRIFDRFYRADAQSTARARKGGGTGLGLSIARDLARAQGGELTAANAGMGAASGGAVFTLEVPAGSR